MALVGMQDVWVTGSRFYFDRDDTTNNYLLDLGTVDTANPSMEVSKIELKDGDGGRLVTINSEVTEINESYELTVKNFNTEALATLFLASEPSALNQSPSAGAIDPMTVSLHPGHVAKITTSSEGVYGISAATFLKSGASTLTEDSDFKWISKDRGIIKFLAGGSQSLADGDTINTSAITMDSGIHTSSNRRMIYPQQAGGAITGRAYLFYSRRNNAEQSVREFKCSLAPASASFSIDDYSSFSLTASVLSDLTQTNDIAGIMASIKGDEPSVTSIS